MKKRLIALFTVSRSVEQTKDRGGKYSLNKVNQLAKLGPVAKGSAPRAVVAAPPARQEKVDLQPSLFGGVEDAAEVGVLENGGALPSAATNLVEESQPPVTAAVPVAKPEAKERMFSREKLKAVPGTIVKFLAKPAMLLWRKLRGAKPDVRPRAQAELALEKVMVLRNDLSDADVMVVAKERKELKPAESQSTPGTNSWTKATARWIKLKDPAEGETRAEAPAVRPSELAETPP